MGGKIMKRVLIVDDSKIILESLTLALESLESRFILETATNGEEAVEILKDHSISVLITDLNMPVMDGLELLVYMNQNHPKVPCLVITGYGSTDLKTAQAHLGIYAFLEKPFSLEILLKKIDEVLDFIDQSDDSSGVSVAGFLELINLERKSCILQTSHPEEGDGRFFFVGGELYSAQCGDVDGDKAAVKMLCWENVTHCIEDLPSEAIAPDVVCSSKSLILKAEALKHNLKHKLSSAEKEREDEEDFCQPTMFAKAIRLAEGGNAEHAHPILAKLLKHNPRNAEGWLWYSRISNKFKVIKVSLRNASSLDPDNKAIAEEIIKISKAIKAGCKEADTVKRCPFCWMPTTGNAFVCSNCNAQLFIPNKLTRSTQKPNRDLLKKAALRFIRILKVERKNYKARFYLGIAYYNLGNWGKAVAQLYKTKMIVTTDEFYKDQLNFLLAQMESEKSLSGEHVASRQANETKKTILIVDDSSTIRKVLKTILTEDGFEVVEAKNGIDALAKLNEGIPALILLDIIMPEMDGYEVLSAIKNSNAYKDVPVIMLTAKDSLISKVKGKLSGCDDYLTKPFKHNILTTKVREYLH
jgi:twitching motility two-component system response regulator PilG